MKPDDADAKIKFLAAEAGPLDVELDCLVEIVDECDSNAWIHMDSVILLNSVSHGKSCRDNLALAPEKSTWNSGF